MGAVELSFDGGLATLRIGRAHGNAINPDLAQALIHACDQLEVNRSVRGVLFTSAGKLFSPGLDLQELIELDRAAMAEFLALFGRCIRRLYLFPKPVVAAIRGHAVAGGCVLALTADWRVAKRGVRIGLNEVKVGVPFPYDVAMILRESANRSHLTEVAMFGHNYSDEAAVGAGLVHEIAAADGFEEHCMRRLGELAEKDPRAFAMTKRYLRSPVETRMQEADDTHDADFLDAWFSPETQDRIRGIVQQLRARE